MFSSSDNVGSNREKGVYSHMHYCHKSNPRSWLSFPFFFSQYNFFEPKMKKKVILVQTFVNNDL